MTDWDGEERRKFPPHECAFGDKIISLAEDVSEIKSDVKRLDIRINGTLDSFKAHVAEGNFWRKTIVGMVIAVVLNSVLFSYFMGQLSKTVTVNERIIQREILGVRDGEPIHSFRVPTSSRAEVHSGVS